MPMSNMQGREEEKMRCRICPNTTHDTKHQCWTKWQLCVYCATKVHPEEYDPRIIKRIIKTNSSRYVLCQKCDTRMFALRYGTSLRAPFMFCQKCVSVQECELASK